MPRRGIEPPRLQNEYDGHTLPEALEWAEAITGQRPQRASGDRGYRGRQTVGGHRNPPARPAKDQSLSRTQQLRRWFRRRAAIEPVISHSKHDFRLGRCFLRDNVGDRLNEMLAGVRGICASGCGRFYGPCSGGSR